MQRLIPVGYLGSIILLLTSIIYFFAANWSYFTRFEKLGLSVGIMLLFYFVSAITTKFISQQPFLGKWFLVAGAICFGVSVGLIGQIYNSHADSYMLFFVWLIPTVLLALITGYAPLWVVSYVLLHLTYWFYMNPSSYFISRTNLEEWLIYLVVCLINLALFAFTFTNKFRIKIIRYFAYTAVHLALISLSFFELFPPYSGWTNVLYISFAFISFVILKKSKGQQGLTIILFTMASLYICAKIIEIPFLFDHYLGFFAVQLSGTFASLLLILGGIFLARKFTPSGGSKVNSTLKRILIVIVTIIGSIMFASSFGSLLFILTESEYAAVIVSLLFILTGLLFKKLDNTARHTILIIGFFSGMFGAIFLSSFITTLYLLISLAVFITIKDGVVRFISYVALLITTLSFVFDDLQLGDHIELVFLVFAVINGVLAFLMKAQKDIFRIGLFFFYLFLYALTFLNEEIVLEIIFAILLFIVVTGLLIFFGKNEKLFEFRVSAVFWILSLVTTYYDLVWSLLHKSLSFFIIGLIFFIITWFLDKENKTIGANKTFTRIQWVFVGAVLVLQLSFVSFQMITNEHLINEGKTITLKLAPVDPRSMIQGDYVRLQYEIGEVELGEGRHEGRVFLLLKRNDEGIYSVSKVYKTQIDPTKESLAEDEVIIAGKYNGYNQIIFGIESYFVPEGTGLEVERNAEFAKVAVSQKGDALLLTIE
ncbi:GDYXXLXY domain-containing protein [Bacillus luteolus]|uniref:GDYXXLXY domain-containing protein n=1 Tax=Litchfieldia luteola TaxID=682179 RepID=A0ABR9QE17_9BACI|nr:GDYXXLXY domain-containing protein [Cytobacillus luteolus]MBE4906738.1 GDYXXLXY domain-containing protein [Cytobacillus luteolus]MBP1940612.1 putative membrane-anchored protein/putative membrane protein [Cytobacillus luteolus]